MPACIEGGTFGSCRISHAAIHFQRRANHEAQCSVKRPHWTYFGPIVEVLSVEPSEMESVAWIVNKEETNHTGSER